MDEKEQGNNRGDLESILALMDRFDKATGDLEGSHVRSATGGGSVVFGKGKSHCSFGLGEFSS